MNAPVSPDHHGDSPAAWISVAIMLIGFAVGTVAFFLAIVPIVFVGVAIIVVGFILWPLLAKLGYGVHGPRYTSKAHS
jgi:site-specific recombinase